MRQIQAYIKPQRLSEVTLALHRVEGLTGMSAAGVIVFGYGRAPTNELTRTGMHDSGGYRR